MSDIPDSIVADARKTAALVRANAANHAVLLRILDLVQDAVDVCDLEVAIQDLPEYRTATQPPYCLVEWLQQTGAVELVDIGQDGEPVSAEKREGLSEDELDELVCGQIARITPAGRMAFAHFDSCQQAQDLFESRPFRRSAYLETLAFICEKRSLIEIDRYLRENGLLYLENGDAIQTSSVIGKLSDIGAAVFDGGWVITAGGLKILESERL